MELSVCTNAFAACCLAQGNTASLFALGAEEAVFCMEYRFTGKNDWQKSDGY